MFYSPVIKSQSFSELELGIFLPLSQRLPTPVLLPGKSHGQRSLVGSSPQGHKELDTTEVTEQASMHAFINHLRMLLNFRS